MPKTQIDFLFGKGRMKATNALQISFLKNDSAFKVKSNKTEKALPLLQSTIPNDRCMGTSKIVKFQQLLQQRKFINDRCNYVSNVANHDTIEVKQMSKPGWASNAALRHFESDCGKAGLRLHLIPRAALQHL